MRVVPIGIVRKEHHVGPLVGNDSRDWFDGPDQCSGSFIRVVGFTRSRPLGAVATKSKPRYVQAACSSFHARPADRLDCPGSRRR